MTLNAVSLLVLAEGLAITVWRGYSMMLSLALHRELPSSEPITPLRLITSTWLKCTVPKLARHNRARGR